MELLRFANRVPLVYQQGACSVTQVISDIRWNNYKLSHKGSGLPQGPVAAVVHVASTNVPFTSESKDAVASVEVIENEIERAIRDVSRDLKRYLSEQQSLKKRRRKQDVIAELLPEFSTEISRILGEQTPDISKSLAQIMNNVFVTFSENENVSAECTTTVENFDNNAKQTPVVQVELNEKPTINQSLDYVLTNKNETWVLEWQPTVTPSGETSLTLPIECSNVSNLSVNELPAEKIIIEQPSN